MGRPKASDDTVKQREADVWKLRVVDGMTQWAIGQRLGIDTSTVCKILKRLRARAVGKLDTEVLQIQREQTAQLWQIYWEARESWRLSQPKDPKTGEPTGPGDPAFHETAMKAQDRIRKIWGANAPEKIASTDPTGTQEAGRGTLEAFMTPEVIAAMQAWLPQPGTMQALPGPTKEDEKSLPAPAPEAATP